MRSIKQDLSAGFGLSALVFTCALAWGSPFVSGSSAASTPVSSLTKAQDQPQQAQDQPQQAPSQQSQDKSSTFTGTIVHDGGQYLLRDSSGQVYKLDDPDRAKPFEGKTVKVIGHLDMEAKLIHVEKIESAEA
jgi:uncharacterized protein YdeI (BOF family)